MNILHHKSWHVRNKNNIAKVRAAEKKAREEEEAKEKRKLLAESEARVNFLRIKAHSGDGKQGDAEITQIEAILDGKEPSAVGEDRQNVDHENEAKKDREDWEKKVGILTYLGQGCNDEKPWYLLDHGARMLKKDDPSTSQTDVAKSYLKNDPLLDIERHFSKMKSLKAKETSIKAFTPPVNLTTFKQEVETPQRTKKNKKKHKRKHKKSNKRSRSSAHSKSDSSNSEDSSSSDDDNNAEIERKAKLEALRAERLRREKAERERTNQLLTRSLEQEPKVEFDDRKRSYNSQFNPHLARQNIEKSK